MSEEMLTCEESLRERGHQRQILAIAKQCLRTPSQAGVCSETLLP